MDTISKMIGSIMNLFGKPTKQRGPTKGSPTKGSPRVLDSYGLIDETLTLDVPTEPIKGNLNIVIADDDVESKLSKELE
jgi:hypothetical protein